MIEAAMYVALGFCTAGLIGLAILPAFYRRAARLTEEALRAVNPSSYAEVRAAQDQARARHAVDLRRVERQLESEREKAARYQMDASSTKAAIDELNKIHKTRVSDLETKIAAIEGNQNAVDLLTAEVTTLRQKLADAEKTLADSWSGPAGETGSATAKEQADDDFNWLPATDTMALATITGLEAEVATLKAKLARYEPTVAGELGAARSETARSRLAELEAQLVDTESKYVTAQAEVTRLSLMLDAASVSESEQQERLSAQLRKLVDENTVYRTRLQGKERSLERMTGQLNKLQKDLADTPALSDLRRDFRELTSRILNAGTISITNPMGTAEGISANGKDNIPPASSPSITLNGNSQTGDTPLAPPAAVSGADIRPAKSADIASAADALVSRIVASNRSSAAKEPAPAMATAGEAPVETQQPDDSATKTKSAKQNKKDVA